MRYKAIIPVAGLGTRLLPVTKEQPKEMLPIFAVDSRGKRCVKPMLQLIFEQLYGFGFRDFVFVVGRGKRSVEDHFTPDEGFLLQLGRKGKGDVAATIGQFYEQLRGCLLSWVNQPEPLGFGHAVLMTKHLAGGEPFLVHAGDTYVHSDGSGHIARLIELFEERQAAAVLLLRRARDPRLYGVVEVEDEEGVLRIKAIEEKPERPKSNLTALPIYMFKSIIFEALQVTRPGKGGEIQLTDGIQKLIDWGTPVYGIELKEALVMDVGTPATYWDALTMSYQLSGKQGDDNDG